MTTLPLMLALCFAGQPSLAESVAEEDAESASERMEYMKELAKVYTFRRVDDGKPLELRPDPVLRWNNPVSGVKDGTIFVWTIDGRPELAAQVFRHKTGTWGHEFVSLSTGKFHGFRDQARVWDCNTPGIRLTAIESAPSPEAGETARLRQMRLLAREFKASVDFKIDYRDTQTSHYELRLLEKPVIRYTSGEVLDGAVFAFVQGTNPEVWLILEARRNGEQARWEYAFARQTGYAVQGEHRGKQVWSQQAWKRADPQVGPFFHLQYRP